MELCFSLCPPYPYAHTLKSKNDGSLNDFNEVHKHQESINYASIITALERTPPDSLTLCVSASVA